MPAGDITAEDLLGKVTSQDYILRKTVPILVAPQALLQQHAELEAEFKRSQGQDIAMDSEAPRLADRLAELEDRLEAEFMIEFVVRALPKREWADLLAAHPPTQAQQRADRRADFNPATFPAAAIAACLVTPVMSVEQVEILERGKIVSEEGEPVVREGGLNDAQFNTLFNGVVEVNVSGLSAPLSVAAALSRQVNAASALPPIISESLDQSSLDE